MRFRLKISRCGARKISKPKRISLWSGAPLVLGGILCLLPSGLSANPTGGSVASGSAKIAGQGTGAVTINQASNTTIINWQSFSINAGESTSFLQPGANSAALNRVLGGQASLINGTLSANGQVYLINGNGVIVGPGGVINANAFTASTRNITDADFLSGNLHFTGSSNAGVQNLGTIKALGGNVVLIGKTVDNEGTIKAPGGTVGLIAGDDVLLAQHNADGSTITVSPVTMTTSASGQVGVKNGGAITAAAAELKAANGNIYAMAVQNLGTIRATTVSHQGGHIWLTSDSGEVSNSGTLDASATAPGGKGGTVMLKSASGTVSHTGQIIARGGQGGAGGNAEISGGNVQFTGTVDLTAPNGTLGTLLIDPATVDIVTGGGTDVTASTVDPSAIVLALNSSNIMISATTSITVDDLLDASSNPNPGNLTLASPTVDLNAPVVLNGALNGTANTVNEGPGALVQNGIDVIGSSGGTVNLAAGATYASPSEIVINNNIDLEGNGATLSGQGTTRIMEIDGGSVTLNALTFTGGDGVSTLGAAGASWTGDGGALLVYGQNTTTSVSITNSTFVGNAVTTGGSSGGAIYNVSISGGSNGIFIENCTFTNNSATLGSVLYDYGSFGGSASMGLKEDTIAANSGTGAIYATVLSSGNASVSINNTILSGNTDFSGESDYMDGGGATLNDNGYNLYGEDSNPGGFVPVGTDILLNSDISTVLTPLGSYGGPTPTMALVALSPALGTGDPGFEGAPDQRGIIRASGADFTDGSVDIGAFEAQFVSVQANPAENVYGSTPFFSITVTGGPSTAFVTGSPALVEPATNAGFYGEDIGQGTVTAGPAFIVDFTNGDLTIDQRLVTVDPDPGQGKVYGSPDPVLTYTTDPATATSGLVNGDTLSGSPSYEGFDVGNYGTNLGTIADSTGNYSIVLNSTPATFAITPAVLFYVSDPVQIPVGALYPRFTGIVTGFVNGDTLTSATSGNPLFTTSAAPDALAGFYDITGSGLTANYGNYLFAQVPGNAVALTIGMPMPAMPAMPATPTTPAAGTPAQQAAQPNTPVSQAIAQTTTTTPDPTGSLPGGTNTPLVTPTALPTDINVSSISPNEFIEGTPAQASSSGSTGTGAVAQGSSFDPDIGATAVNGGQAVTMGGRSGVPPPPIVQAQLTQILDTPALGVLSDALASVSPTDEQAASSPDDASAVPSSGASASSTPGTPGLNGIPAGGGSFPNPAGPGAVGPVVVIAPGQPFSISGGRAYAGPPPVFIQAAFNQGFSQESRDAMAAAAGIPH